MRVTAAGRGLDMGGVSAPTYGVACQSLVPDRLSENTLPLAKSHDDDVS